MATPSVSLPGQSHGQTNPVAYSPWGRKESDTTDGTQHTRTWKPQSVCKVHSQFHLRSLQTLVAPSAAWIGLVRHTVIWALNMEELWLTYNTHIASLFNSHYLTKNRQFVRSILRSCLGMMTWCQTHLFGLNFVWQTLHLPFQTYLGSAPLQGGR